MTAVKRIYYFGAGIALGVAATRRTRRAKEAAREALKAKVTPSAIAADVADAIAELGNAVGAFASDVKQGAINRRASYRPLVDNATGAVILVGPEASGPCARSRSSNAPPVPRRRDRRPHNGYPRDRPAIRSEGRDAVPRTPGSAFRQRCPARRSGGTPPTPRPAMCRRAATPTIRLQFSNIHHQP